MEGGHRVNRVYGLADGVIGMVIVIGDGFLGAADICSLADEVVHRHDRGHRVNCRIPDRWSTSGRWGCW